MAANTRTDLASAQPLRYCWTHARAWHPEGGWYALAHHRVRLALRLAREGGCAAQITFVTEPCDHCEKDQPR